VQLGFGERLAQLFLDHIEDPARAGREPEHRPPQIKLHLLDVARGLELLLGTQDVELRHVAEVHRQEARRLVVATAFLRRGRALYRLCFLRFLFIFVVIFVAIVRRLDSGSRQLLGFVLNHLLDGLGRGSLDSHIRKHGQT